MSDGTSSLDGKMLLFQRDFVACQAKCRKQHEELEKPLDAIHLELARLGAQFADELKALHHQMDVIIRILGGQNSSTKREGTKRNSRNGKGRT